ncbi:acyl-CoA dehydrogenase family protein [Nocardia seriolae]|uniref:Acyl-CoA dehydrogenase n=1 Tax=Nocardia seriolae TaxID=37332 RepID=A0A0B8NNJ1_9NOCA|nr:acyl-CoA dehydrogenase family protein [Nocardia seriolae]APA99795.1 putative acyl-CoA dehydrogenase [Nocardia seriolae]MTJ62616.1 acyl-CoA dehydrogenase [Nocardia seriolae]MTJ76549.1 acyl-CoA dehydrogenase [Nocardia seriolae]MTJ89343.1 acyl-CoA dehydrogenase [Nocardia seriolae]MTK33320.1 acyl-CoA dehydrogenase [Nocardia seriolae]
MSLQLTDEQRSLVRTVREFAARECGTREQRLALTDHGRKGSNLDIATELAELGFLGLSLPEEYGGSGGGLFDACLFIEELAYGRIPLASFPVTLIVAHSYAKFASTEIKNEVLGSVTAGVPTAIAMSEPGSGSDVASLTCKAEKVEGGYRVNGQKTWISNGHIAEHILLVCRTGDGADKHQGLTMLSVPTGTPGIEIRPIATMAAEVNDVFFTDVFVPQERLVGVEGQGWSQLIAGLNIERVIIAALGLGQARRVFDDTLAYVKQRKQFGRPIGSFQALSQRLADLATELEATRLLVHDVAQRVDENPGALLQREASMAKYKATELAKHAALEGIQMMGGMGYTQEAGMEELLRHTIVGTIVGGTSEIQKDIIAKTLGL